MASCPPKGSATLAEANLGGIRYEKVTRLGGSSKTCVHLERVIGEVSLNGLRTLYAHKLLRHKKSPGGARASYSEGMIDFRG